MSSSLVSMATNLRVNKHEDTPSIADSGHETGDIATTFTKMSQISEVRQ